MFLKIFKYYTVLSSYFKSLYNAFALLPIKISLIAQIVKICLFLMWSRKSSSAIRSKMNMHPYEHKFQRVKSFRFVL